MKETTIRSKRLISLALIALAALAAAHGLGCASPEQRHRTLTFFFDGVPPLRPEESEPDLDELDRDVGERGLPRPSDAQIVSIHGPVAQKECEQCHASGRSNRLVEPKPDLCWSCHDRADFPGEVVHGPVAAGLCEACHDPHRSQHPHLLVRAPTQLCEGCHDEFTYPRLAEHRSAKGDDCQSCHDPHAADREYMLKRDEEPS